MTLLLHPVRLRIVQATYDEQIFTTAQLCERLPDVSKATLYRQVAMLVDGGMIEVVHEQRIRGAVERSYRLRRSRTVPAAEEMALMSKDDHRRGFAAVTASLLAEFDLYLDRDDADPDADALSYRQFSLWLSEEERTSLIEEIRVAITARAGNLPDEGRERYLLTPVLVPAKLGDVADGS